MTKNELVEKISSKVNGLTKSKAEDTVNATIEILRESLVAGDSVVLTGFGSFKVVTRAERKGHNPQSHQTITIPARKVAKFTPGKALREAVNK
ncbi:MAG: HU family DNA-binding protein [Desulfovibrio sp.]|nr:HU family DNA-binding protein [Desulfovibrio sp.]